jgi:hypothetical protein
MGLEGALKDPKVAEKLIPKDHGFGTRRVPLESGYFEAYNRDNVLLVNLNEKPIERITPNEGRSVRRVLGYNGNGVHYRRKCEEVASDGYREFAFR